MRVLIFVSHLFRAECRKIVANFAGERLHCLMYLVALRTRSDKKAFRQINVVKIKSSPIAALVRNNHLCPGPGAALCKSGRTCSDHANLELGGIKCNILPVYFFQAQSVIFRSRTHIVHHKRGQIGEFYH